MGCKPRRGGMFIAASPLKNILFVFRRRGVVAHWRGHDHLRRAAEKQKATGELRACYKHATPTGFCAGAQNESLCLLHQVVGNDKVARGEGSATPFCSSAQSIEIAWHVESALAFAPNRRWEL
jgi:hypothetical protein